MTHAITNKNHVTVTKTSLEQLHVLIGRRTDCELTPHDGVGLILANQQFDDNPYRQMVGIGIGKRSTAEIKKTRGNDFQVACFFPEVPQILN